MTATRLKALVVALLMVASFIAAAALRPTAKLADQRAKTDLEAMFPKRIADWVVDDRMPVQLISPDTAALLSKIYNQTLSRTYVNPRGERIMLSVAYGGDQSDGTRAHRPEVCYPAQGFQLLDKVDTTLPVSLGPLPVRRLVTRLGGRNEPITYWMVVGDRVTLTGTQQKLVQLSYSMRGLVPDGMLVRVSSISPDPVAAYALQAQFIQQLHGAVTPAQAERIFGRLGADTRVSAGGMPSPARGL